MQDSQTPPKIPLPWGNSAGGSFIRTVPTASQIGIQNGAASLTDGFPPNCFIPIATGGAGPFGQDMNGILNQITAGLRWAQAGGPIFYDAVFSAAIGGYPKATVLSKVSTPGLFWISTVDNNTTDPDASGANWSAFPPAIPSRLPLSTVQVTATGSYTVAVPAGATLADITANGAGGGGGGVSTSNGGASGGAGGAFFHCQIAVSGSSVTGVIGAGGAASTGSGSASAGGSTTVIYSAVTRTAGGGNAGLSASGNTQNSVVGGVVSGSGFIVALAGQPSFGGFQGVAYSGGTGGASANGGYGGNAGTGAGNPGGAPGGGGGGAGGNSAALVAGGNGGNGQVTISFYG